MTKWKIENVDSPPPPTSTCSTFVHWTVKWYAEKSANKLIRKRISSHQSVCSIVPPARDNNWILSRKVSSEKHGFIHIDWHRYRFFCFAAAQSLFREELFARFQLLFLVTEVWVCIAIATANVLYVFNKSKCRNAWRSLRASIITFPLRIYLDSIDQKWMKENVRM